jgi:hypothetical protein
LEYVSAVVATEGDALWASCGRYFGSVQTFDTSLKAYSTEGWDWSVLWSQDILTAGCADAVSDGVDSLLLAGSFDDTATFDPGGLNETVLTTADPTTNDLFVVEYSWDGEFLGVAARSNCPAGSACGARPMASVESGGFYLAGWMYGDLLLGEGEPNETVLTATEETADSFLARFDESGQLVWARQIGGLGTETVTDIAVLDDGSTVLAAHFDSNEVVVGLGETDEAVLTSFGDVDVLLTRFGADGGVDWAVTAGGMGLDYAQGVTVAGTDIFAAGSCEDGAVFGAGELGETTVETAGGRDVWVAKFVADGSLAWLRTAGGAGDDGATSVAVTGDGSLRVAGSFEGEAVFGQGEPNETVAESFHRDAFLMKLNP